jgi:hypothetical protein
MTSAQLNNPRARGCLWSVVPVLLVLTGCSGPYADLAKDFAADGEPAGLLVKGSQVVMASTRHRGAYTFGGRQVFVSDTAVDIRAESSTFGLLPNLRLPATGVSGCSMTCFGSRDRRANLVLAQQGAEVSFEAASEIVEWCWQNGLPMFSGADKRGWLYEGRPLPSKAAYVRAARDVYEQQADRACMGY